MREYWFLGMNPLFSWIGYILEPYVLKMYQKIPTITVSNSTKNDLKRLGFEYIYVIPPGLNVRPLEELPKKNDTPTMIYLGRLKKTKRPDYAIRAFHYLVKELNNVQLWIVGDGPYRKDLEKLVKKLNLNGKVRIFGRVDEQKKYKLLKKSHVLIIPSIREGFPIVPLEANAMGTPAIGFNVPGVRDVIKHEETGLILRKDDMKGLVNALITLFEDHDFRNKLSLKALQWAKRFTWENTFQKFSQVLSRRIEES
jgi:glycosyltransferase involved in cell wall biosynthesis